MTAVPDKPPRKPPNTIPPPEDTSAPEVYVVRLAEPSRRFAWEIRRLSTIVVERSREDFATVDAARAAGQATLDVFSTVGFRTQSTGER